MFRHIGAISLHDYLNNLLYDSLHRIIEHQKLAASIWKAFAKF